MHGFDLRPLRVDETWWEGPAFELLLLVGDHRAAGRITSAFEDLVRAVSCHGPWGCPSEIGIPENTSTPGSLAPPRYVLWNLQNHGLVGACVWMRPPELVVTVPPLEMKRLALQFPWRGTDCLSLAEVGRFHRAVIGEVMGWKEYMPIRAALLQMQDWCCSLHDDDQGLYVAKDVATACRIQGTVKSKLVQMPWCHPFLQSCKTGTNIGEYPSSVDQNGL